eukprot:18773-Pelagomonas_calceolata.AAC.2
MEERSWRASCWMSCHSPSDHCGCCSCRYLSWQGGRRAGDQLRREAACGVMLGQGRHAQLCEVARSTFAPRAQHPCHLHSGAEPWLLPAQGVRKGGKGGKDTLVLVPVHLKTLRPLRAQRCQAHLLFCEHIAGVNAVCSGTVCCHSCSWPRICACVPGCTPVWRTPPLASLHLDAVTHFDVTVHRRAFPLRGGGLSTLHYRPWWALVCSARSTQTQGLAYAPRRMQ